MKKTAIVTLNGYFNYGNRLQNFALQEALESLGHEVETLRINRDKRSNRYKPYLRELKSLLLSPRNYHNEKKRKEIFIDFSRTYIAEREAIIYVDDDLSEINSNYQHFVVGSDQVWNPKMNKLSSLFFLNFADNHKRIAYAPSFGVSNVSKDVESIYQKWINDIPYLSVREDDGAKIIKEITERDALVVVDPTLLVSKERWLEIGKTSKEEIVEKYLLTYFLGGIPENYKTQINKLAESKSLKIINLGDVNDINTYRTGPSEFINYINNCSLFCTDSFHGVVFSILLEKPFVVYERIGSVSMYSRIDTLLEKFKLTSRKSEVIDINDKAFSIDFSHTKPILDKERETAFDFLRKALNAKEE